MCIRDSHPDELQRVCNRTMVGGTRPPERAEPRVATHHHHVPDGDGELPVDLLRLWDVRDPARLAAGLGAEDVDVAAPWFQEARDDLEERALPAAVRPE